MPCASIWKSAPCTPASVSVTMPSTTNPRCETDEYATSFFASSCTYAISAPKMMPITARIATSGASCAAASGNIGQAKRRKP